jgi:hypothetical protein
MKLLCAVLALLIAEGVLASEEFSKEGKVTLQKYTVGGDSSAKTVIKLGEKVTFEINAYIGEFFKKPIIDANAKIRNTTAVPMHAIYVIRFYDAKNQVVGAHATSWTLKPNEDINYGSALIRGKEEDFKRVTHYSVYTCSYETVPEAGR